MMRKILKILKIFNFGINKLYKKYVNEMEKFSKELDENLKNMTKEQKKIKLNNSIKLCDILIDENKELIKNNLTGKIFKALKVVVIWVITYAIAKDDFANHIIKGFKKNLLSGICISFFVVFLVVVFYFLSQEIVKEIYYGKIRKVSLKKIVIQSKLEEI